MAGHSRRIDANRSVGVYGAVFLLALVVLALLGHFGLPDTAIATALIAVMLVSLVVAAFGARTMSASAFFVVGRNLSAPVNGVAIAAAFMSGGVYLGLAGAFAADGVGAVALTVGWSAGFLLMAVLIAPFFRRSGAYGLAGLLAIRYGGRIVRLTAVMVMTIALMCALAGAFGAAALVGEIGFGWAPATSVTVLAVVTALIVLPGGMRSTTAAALLQYLTLTIALLAPAVLISASRSAGPLPHLGFGFAAQQADAIAATLGSDIAAPSIGPMLAAVPSGVIDFALTVLALAAAVASLPHLLNRAATVPDGDLARRSIGWGLVFILAVILVAPAYAAFARLGLLADLTGTRLLDLPAWLIDLGRQGLVDVCGRPLLSHGAVFSACPLPDGGATVLRAGDIALSTDVFVLGWPAVLGLPPVATALIAVGALAALSGVAGMLAITVANGLGHDLYGRILAPRASAGRRLIATRIAVVVALATAAWIVLPDPADARGLATWSLAISAGGLAPATVLGIWWQRANVIGAVAGMIAGAALALMMLMQTYGFGAPAMWPLDVTAYGLSPFTIGFFAAAIGSGVVAAVSAVSPPPSLARLAVLDAIRQPDATLPLIDEQD